LADSVPQLQSPGDAHASGDFAAVNSVQQS
jgi:hypothetical protein